MLQYCKWIHNNFLFPQIKCRIFVRWHTFKCKFLLNNILWLERSHKTITTPQVPSGSSNLAMPRWFSAVEKALSRLTRALCWRTWSMSTRSGLIVWTMALNARPSRHDFPKSLTSIPYFLKMKQVQYNYFTQDIVFHYLYKCCRFRLQGHLYSKYISSFIRHV